MGESLRLAVAEHTDAGPTGRRVLVELAAKGPMTLVICEPGEPLSAAKHITFSVADLRLIANALQLPHWALGVADG